MKRSLGYVTVVVRNYDEAIAYYTGVLGFALIEDTRLDATKRWVLVAPEPKSATCLVLAQAVTAREKKAVGNQTGGRVFLFLHTDNFARDYRKFRARGVTFREEPRHEAYGSVAVFADLYGNLWDLLELKRRRQARRSS